jgi:hypothetical protein
MTAGGALEPVGGLRRFARIAVIRDALPRRPTFGPRLWLAAYAVPTLGYVLFALHFPLAVLAPADHDDGLFINLAMWLTHLQWLGPYNELTLAKGPGFPLFLAANYALGVPITLSLALLYAGAAFVAVKTFVHVGLHPVLGVAAFVLMLFHPGMLPTRVVRDDICGSLALVALAGALVILAGGREVWRPRLTAAACGVALGLLWITREDSVWIAPGLVFVIAFAFVHARHDRETVRRIRALVSCYAIGMAVVVGSIAVLNLGAYHRLLITDFTDPSFEHAIKALNSVDVGPNVLDVPVPAARRAAIYAVSPALTELKDVLEDPHNGWLDSGCQAMPSTCGDFAGGWWPWALRDAVSKRGYYSSPGNAAEFYDRVANDINRACDARAFACRSNPIPFIPNLGATQLGLMPNAILRAWAVLAVVDTVNLAGPSLGSPDQLDRDRRYLGQPPTTAALSELGIYVSGWYRPTDGSWLSLTCSDGGSGLVIAAVPLGRLPSPDLVTAFSDPTLTSNRFTITAPGQAGCSLSPASDPADRIPLASILDTGPGAYDLHAGSLQIQQVQAFPGSTAWPTAVFAALVRIYSVLLLAVAIGGGACLVGGLLIGVRRRRFPTQLVVAMAAILVMVLCRVAILVLVDVSSFNAIDALYMQSVFPMSVLAGIAGIGVLYAAARPAAPASAADDPVSDDPAHPM